VAHGAVPRLPAELTPARSTPLRGGASSAEFDEHAARVPRLPAETSRPRCTGPRRSRCWVATGAEDELLYFCELSGDHSASSRTTCSARSGRSARGAAQRAAALALCGRRGRPAGAAPRRRAHSRTSGTGTRRCCCRTGPAETVRAWREAGQPCWTRCACCPRSCATSRSVGDDAAPRRAPACVPAAGLRRAPPSAGAQRDAGRA